MSGRELRSIILNGLTPYDEAHRLQLKTVDEVKSGEARDTLILLEHRPVITLGRNADPAGVTSSREELEAHGIEVRTVERGGQVTYHGPGQVVGYPIVNLKRLKKGVKYFVAGLEEVMIRAAAGFGVEAGRKEGIVGVFCDIGKIGAVGVRVSGGVTFHGFAFNVRPNLGHYRLIVPCGMTDIPVTSIAALTGESPSVKEAMSMIADAFAAVFDYSGV